MAKAKIADIVERVVRPGVVLELSKDEARMLYAVLQRVGGDDQHSPRRFADTIADALQSVDLDFQWGRPEYDAYSRTLAGHLKFERSA